MTREPEWDDETRGRVLRLQEHDESFCTCGCNLPIEVAYDPDRVLVVDDFKCFAGRALDMVRRQRAEDAKKNNLPDGWDAGVHLYVREHDPARDKPLKPPSIPGRAHGRERQVGPRPTQG